MENEQIISLLDWLENEETMKLCGREVMVLTPGAFLYSTMHGTGQLQHSPLNRIIPLQLIWIMYCICICVFQYSSLAVKSASIALMFESMRA
jgi:hypothetical protein